MYLMDIRWLVLSQTSYWGLTWRIDGCDVTLFNENSLFIEYVLAQSFFVN
eukprot:m.344166 g.344166  ORF g.344166 m.344166 type:complete len:50 (+) comp23908_c0_seq1:574-723(+)